MFVLLWVFGCFYVVFVFGIIGGTRQSQNNADKNYQNNKSMRSGLLRPFKITRMNSIVVQCKLGNYGWKIGSQPILICKPLNLSVTIADSSGVVAKQSAVIAQKYQNQKVHDQACSEHPKLQESTQQSQSYVDLKKTPFFRTDFAGFRVNLRSDDDVLC